MNTKNKGITYNSLEDKPNVVKLITSIITAAFGVFFIKITLNPAAKSGLKFGSAMIFGGSLGNLIDRFKNGSVTDFIYIKAVKKSPIFNFADVFILFGAVLVAFFDIKK